MRRVALILLAGCTLFAATADASMRQLEQPTSAGAPRVGGEANLILPDLGRVRVLGFNARTLLMMGIGVCALGLIFGLSSFARLKRLPVHRAMLDVSELIYETCKTYLT